MLNTQLLMEPIVAPANSWKLCPGVSSAKGLLAATEVAGHWMDCWLKAIVDRLSFTLARLNVSDILRCCEEEADLYAVRLWKFLCPLSWVTKLSGTPASSKREIEALRTEWFATFLFFNWRPALRAAFERKFPIWFFPSGEDLYQIAFWLCRQLWFTARKKGDSGSLAFSGRWLSKTL